MRTLVRFHIPRIHRLCPSSRRGTMPAEAAGPPPLARAPARWSVQRIVLTAGLVVVAATLVWLSTASSNMADSIERNTDRGQLRVGAHTSAAESHAGGHMEGHTAGSLGDTGAGGDAAAWMTGGGSDGGTPHPDNMDVGAAPAMPGAGTDPSPGSQGASKPVSVGGVDVSPVDALNDAMALRDADLIVRAATAAAERIVASAELIAKATQSCVCDTPREHPLGTGVLCPSGCSGHGRCDKGCQCEPGWGGWGCYTRLSAAEAGDPKQKLTAVITPGDAACASEQLALARKWVAKVEVVVVVPDGMADPSSAAHPRMAVVHAPAGATLGQRLALGVAGVKSPYVAVLGADTTFSRFSDVAAMTRTLQQTDLDLVGAIVEVDRGTRLVDDCYQMRVTNYTAAYAWGYKQSQRGCMVCDRISSAFVARTASVRPGGVLEFDTALDSEAVYTDLWLRGKRSSRLAFGHCAQIQLHRVDRCVAPEAAPDSVGARALAAGYAALGSKWGISSFQRPGPEPQLRAQAEAAAAGKGGSGHEPRTEVRACGAGGSASGANGLANDVCVAEDMQRLLYATTGLLEAVGVAHAVAGDTYLGAIKFRNLLPWQRTLEVDAWGSGQQLEALWQVATSTWEKDYQEATEEQGGVGMAVRVDGELRGSEGTALMLVVHQLGAGWHTLALTYRRTDVGGTPVTLRGATVSGPTAAFAADLPTAPRALGPDNLMWVAPGAGTDARGGGGGAGYIATPTARVQVGGRWLSGRRYPAPYIEEVYGRDAWVLNVPNTVAPPDTELADGSETATSLSDARLSALREAAVYRGSDVCGPARHTTGCLDNWVWAQDWLNFNEPGEYPWHTP